MTGSALSKLTELTQLRCTFHEVKKEMRLRRLGGGFGRGKGSGARSGSESADDGKRFVEVPSGTSCAERFIRKKEMILRRIGGGPGGGWARERAVILAWADL